MDKTLQSLLTLAREGNVERRSAALLVLGALKLDEDSVVETVGAALGNVNVILKDYALRYFEEVRSKSSIPLLLPLLEEGDKELTERVVRLLAGFGQAVVRPLLQKAKTANRSGQSLAVRILCAIRGKAAWQALLQILLVGDTEVNKIACDLMVTTLRQIDEKEHEELFAELESFVPKLNQESSPAALISMIRLFGMLGKPQIRKWLIGFVGPDQHHSVRFHALVALLHCLRQQDLLKTEYTRLFPILEEPEFSDSMRLTLDLLDAHPLSEEHQPMLARLIGSPHVAVQKFALRKMGEFGSPAVVRTLMQQLGDPDAARRDAAARSLRKIPTARSALTKEFLACDEASKAWSMAEILPTYEGKWRRDTLAEAWTRLQEALDADDRIYGAYLHFLKNVDPEYIYGQLAARGAQLKKAKKYREAVRVLSLLKDFPMHTAAESFALAVAQFKLHPHDIASGVGRHDPTLEAFVDLYRSSAFPLLDALKKEKALDPDDLFYLGFRLSEGSTEGRNLGEEILEILADQYPRTKVGKSAKNKLKLLAS